MNAQGENIMSNLDYSPTILYEDARTQYLEKELNGFSHITMKSRVHCIHCGDEYYYNEANAVVSPDDGETTALASL